MSNKIDLKGKNAVVTGAGWAVTTTVTRPVAMTSTPVTR